MTLALLLLLAGVVAVVLVVLLRALRGARSREVLEDPHRPGVAASLPAVSAMPSTPGPTRSRAAAGEVEPVAMVRDYLIEMARATLGVDLEHDGLAKQRLGDAAVIAIEQLRKHESADINLPFLYADASGPKHFRLELRRAELEMLLGRRPG